MSGLGPVELVLVLLVLLLMLAVPVALVALVVVLVRRGRRDPGLADEPVERGRRHQSVSSLLAVAAALLTVPVCLVLGGVLGQGSVLPLIPSLVVAVACVVLWGGELTFPRAGGDVRSTVLNVRTPSTVVPRSWLRVCAGLAALDLAILVVGVLTADDGHTFSWHDGPSTYSRSPYPGLDYAGPQALALALAGALTWLVIRSTTTRPTIPTDLAGDLVLRRASAARVLRWLAWGLAATGAADLFIIGLAVQHVPGWHAAGVVALVVSAALALAVVVLPFVPLPQLASAVRREPLRSR